MTVKIVITILNRWPFWKFGVVFHDYQDCENKFEFVTILKIRDQGANIQIAVIYINFDIKV
jgi:hypothetical protein